MKTAFYFLMALIVSGFIVGIFLPGWLLFPIGIGAGYAGKSIRSANQRSLSAGRK